MRIEKKRYSRGYHVAWSGSKPSTENFNMPHCVSAKEGSQQPCITKNNTDLTTSNVDNKPVEGRSPICTSKEVDIAPHKKVSTAACEKSFGVAKRRVQAQVGSPQLPVQFEGTAGMDGSKRKSNDRGFLFFTALIGTAIAIPMSRLFRTRSKISFWARSNKYKTWAGIVLARILTGGAGFVAGLSLHENDIHLTDVSFYTLMSAFAVLFFTHPFRKVKEGFFRFTYYKQKLYALLLTMLGVSMLVVAGNKYTAYTTVNPYVAKVVHCVDRRQ